MQGKLIYEFGPFRLEPAEHRLLRGGRPINLSSQLFSLLLVFVENSGTLISKEELRNKVWGKAFISEDALKVIIGNLRKAIGENGERYIETVRGEGYRFIAPVTRIEIPVPAQEVPDDEAVRPSSPPRIAPQQGSQIPVFQRRHLPRLFWVAVRQLWPKWKQALVIVTPETVVRWPPRWIQEVLDLAFASSERHGTKASSVVPSFFLGSTTR